MYLFAQYSYQTFPALQWFLHSITKLYLIQQLVRRANSWNGSWYTVNKIYHIFLFYGWLLLEKVLKFRFWQIINYKQINTNKCDSKYISKKEANIYLADALVTDKIIIMRIVINIVMQRKFLHT